VEKEEIEEWKKEKQIFLLKRLNKMLRLYKRSILLSCVTFILANVGDNHLKE